jgi:hypothetical protein
MLLDTVSAPLFYALSRVRRARVFHPRGAAYEAVWRPAAGSPLNTLAVGADDERQAVVRFSRGVGLPPPAPDVLGVAIKVLDAHGPGHDQDLLLASVGSGPLGSRMLRPARSFSATSFSSLLPYNVSGTRTPVIAAVHGEPLTSVEKVDERPDVRIEVSLERSGQALASVTLTGLLCASVARDLRFDPWNTGGSMQPAGTLNRIRRPVYEASQHGRSAPPDGARLRLARPKS